MNLSPKLAFSKLIMFGCALALAACSTIPKQEFRHDSLPDQFQVSVGGFTGPSYSVQLQGDHLIYSTTDGPRHRKIRPSSEAWRQFWRDVEPLELWEWRAEYKLPAYAVVNDGTQWHIAITYKDHQITSSGDNAYPSDYDPHVTGWKAGEQTERFHKLSAAISHLIGNLPFY